MAIRPKKFNSSWKSFEDAARAIINFHKAYFGLEEVEPGPGHVLGESGHLWSIEGIGYTEGGRKTVLFECKRRTRNIEPETAGGFVYRIQDTGAETGYFVTVMTRKLGRGAKKIAEKEGVGLIQINAEATVQDYVMKHANNYFIGLHDEMHHTESLSVKIEYSDGRPSEFRTIIPPPSED